MKTLKLMGVFIVATLGSLSLLCAQSPSTPRAIPSAPTGAVEHINVHGKFLEGNLEGDSPDRDVAVYLPSSYAKNPHRRYPVVYFLHGWTQSSDKWYGPAKFLSLIHISEPTRPY